MKIEHNISRIKYLLEMYRLNVHEFLGIISEGLKTPLTEEDIFSDKIKVSHLKRIDKIFEKGLHYYLDPTAPENAKEASVFFRKKKFQNDRLNLSAIKIVNKFEELKLSLSAIAKLSDLNFQRQIKRFSVSDNPKEVALNVRKVLYPGFIKNRRDFLKELINSLASKNIMVFEFVESWNKKEKANIDGFYLKPNMIVLKRYQAFTREIFTLSHELGHYLLEKEEIEEIDFTKNNLTVSKVEMWCNDFAFYFLAGEYANILSNLEKATHENDYHYEYIEKVSKSTHLSKLAIFTYLLYHGKISHEDYKSVREEYEELYREKETEKKLKKEELKAKGIKQKGYAPKPIHSPLFVSTIQTAYYEGILNEYEICKKLNIKPDKLEQYI